MIYNINKGIDIEKFDTDEKMAMENRHILKRLDNSTIEYMCFNYALDIYDMEYIEHGISYLNQNGKRIPLEKAKKGDIIVFYDAYGNAQHFAKIYFTDGTIENTIIRAKFGAWGLYEHKLEYTPYMYGNTFEIFRLKKQKTVVAS